MQSVSLCGSFVENATGKALCAGLLCQWVRYGPTSNPLVSGAPPDQEIQCKTIFCCDM